VPRYTRDEPDEEDEYGDDPDWDTGDDYDPEDPETYPQGLYDDDGPPNVPCPHCGAGVFEDAEQCPKCGAYLSREDAPTGNKSGAWWVLIVLCLFAAALWALGRG
jgi:hypothetical protein